MAEIGDGILQFGPFRLDRTRGQLLRGDDEVRLRPTAWEVLRYLAEHPGEVVSIEALLDHCWKDLAVSPQSATNVLYGLRTTLAEHGGDADWIRTVSRRGYRFTAPVFGMAPASDVALPSAPKPVSQLPLFVGRDRELSSLQQRWQRVLGREPQVVFVSGEPGIGKTTLVRRFCSSLGTGAQVCVGRCISQQREAEPYMPVLEALGSLDSMKDIVAVARDEAPNWLLQMPWLVSREERAAIRQSLTDVGPARMLREVKRLMSLLAERAPLLLVLEDVHWADSATADLIRSLVQGGHGSRLMLIATFRSSELLIRDHSLRDVAIDLPARNPDVGLLALDSLPGGDVAEYLERRFGDAELSAQIGPALEMKSGGNPLFLEALTSYLCEQGRVVLRDDKWQLTAPLAELDVGLPVGLREMVRMQLRHLDKEHVRLLEAGSAAGSSFTTLELAAALEMSPADAEDACWSLAHHGHLLRATGEVTWPDGSIGEAYQFSHVTYHQAIRDDTPPSRRRTLHSRIGTRLVEAYGRRAREIAPRLAAHFEAAGDLEREFEYLKLSVQLAASRYAHRETLAYIDRALEVLRQLPATEDRDLQQLGWQTERSNLLMDWRGYAAGYESFAEVVEMAREQRNSFLEFIGHIGCATSALFGREHRENARRDSEAALDLAAREHPQLVTLAHVIAGCVSDAAGDPIDAIAHGEAALAALPDAMSGIPRGYDIEAFVRVLLSGNLMRCGDLERARHERELAVAGAESRSAVDGKAFAFAFMACDALIFGEPEVARDFAARAIIHAQEGGLEHFVLAGEAARQAALSMLAPDHAIDAEGLDRMESALEKRRTLGENWYNMLLSAYLADARRRRGELDKAASLIDGAFDDVEPVYTAELWRIKGEIEADAAKSARPADRTKRIATAAEHFRSAIAIARQHGTKLFELRSSLALARLLDGQEGSAQDLAKIHAWFPPSAEGADVRNAAELLRTLPR